MKSFVITKNYSMEVADVIGKVEIEDEHADLLTNGFYCVYLVAMGWTKGTDRGISGFSLVPGTAPDLNALFPRPALFMPPGTLKEVKNGKKRKAKK